jgi:hypothetical protein
MSAVPLVKLKRVFADGCIIEMRIWRLPAASVERPHGLKYSLFYGRSAERIVAYDNEAGKGDHRHPREREEAYLFVSLEKLIADFQQDVAKERGDE